MEHTQMIRAIEYELMKAKKKWPEYYDDVIHATALVNEEAGEAVQAALDLTYDNGSIDHVREELIQTAAMCFRALENIDNLKVYPHKI